MLNYIKDFFHNYIVKSLGRCQGCGAISQNYCDDCIKEGHNLL